MTKEPYILWQKSPKNSDKRALHILTKKPYIFRQENPIYIDKRALYFWWHATCISVGCHVDVLFLALVSLKYILTKKPYMFIYILTKEPKFLWHATCISVGYRVDVLFLALVLLSSLCYQRDLQKSPIFFVTRRVHSCGKSRRCEVDILLNI